MSRCCAASLLMFTCVLPLAAARPGPGLQPLVRTVDLNLGRSRDFEKSNASVANPPPGRDALVQQARRCRHILKTSLVDFYLPACVDQSNGGFLETLRGGRFTPSGAKFLTMQGRQLWFFSMLACEGVEQKAALAAAKTGFDFLES